jgi:hypothetical protein
MLNDLKKFAAKVMKKNCDHVASYLYLHCPPPWLNDQPREEQAGKVKRLRQSIHSKTSSKQKFN